MKIITFLRKVFAISPFIVKLMYIFIPNFTNYIQNFYNKNNKLFLIIILIASILYIINLVAFIIYHLKNRVNLKYCKDNDTFILKGRKNNFVITKNDKHSFLVKDGMIVAYKPNKSLSSFKYYKE